MAGIDLDPTRPGVDLKTFAHQPSPIDLLVAAVAQVELHGRHPGTSSRRSSALGRAPAPHRRSPARVRLVPPAPPVVPFLVPLWLLRSLVHRAWRDEQRCAADCGPVWDEYRRVARLRMFPGVD
ncbi:hypothetical protein K7C98_24815 [Nannocystis pusilla]|uniref:Uncharacterized protein n=1 Tax=Nannocystis pusilla TaxID=889268 RepID=A0ABS7TW31_9BACT|nr:hypothetical protein [Nannocystis pusilla]